MYGGYVRFYPKFVDLLASFDIVGKITTDLVACQKVIFFLVPNEIMIIVNAIVPLLISRMVTYIYVIWLDHDTRRHQWNFLQHGLTFHRRGAHNWFGVGAN